MAKSQINIMNEQALFTSLVYSDSPTNMVSQFRQEYLGYQSLLRLQPPMVQRFLETQASAMAEVVVKGEVQIRFSLPDRVSLQLASEEQKTIVVPGQMREQIVGDLVGRLIRSDLRTALRSRLLELEQSTHLSVSASAVLVRHVLVMHMVHNLLPFGKTVQYASSEGDEIPNLPVNDTLMTKSALTASSDARTVEDDQSMSARGNLSVPYVEAARRFYLPQWVSFDDDGNLLVANVAEAEAHIASMQSYLSVLHIAVGLAPYIVADEDYQTKRYGILGQLVNQGRALAHFEVKEIIQTIRRRSAEHDLDRGLSISLPYFNDQTLRVEEAYFDVIPSGRIMFVPAFVVLAVRAQAAKVAQDTRLSHSTRRQLLIELSSLEDTFLR